MLKIFPAGITPDGEKVPLIPWRDNASSDPQVIAEWQRKYGDQIKLWGLPMGEVNGMFALDIDVKDGVSGFDSLKSIGVHELPVTAYQMTPSGGMHLFFKYDPAHNKNSVNVDLKLDTRTDGGFVWSYDPIFSIPLAQIPEWINKVKKVPKLNVTNNDAFKTPVKLDPAISLESFNHSIEMILQAGAGERNNTLNTHAYVIGKLVGGGGIEKEFAYNQLMFAASRIGLSEREAYSTIMSGLSGGEQNPQTSMFGDIKPVIAIKIPEVYQPVQRDRWTPKFGTVAQLMNKSKLKKPQLFQEWSTEDIHLTSAIGGVGKTTLKLFEAVCLALGEDFLGFKCNRKGRTLFIIGEDSEDKLYANLGEMLEQMGLQSQMEYILTQIVIKKASDICLVDSDPKTRGFTPSNEAWEKVKEAVDDLKPDQIIFDPIAMFWGAESGGNDMAMALAKFMNRLQEYSNASIDMITHIGKDSATKKDLSQFSGRGGTALANHSRVVRTYLKLNETEYNDQTGRSLGFGETAIYVMVSKFSDGSAILDKPFIILRSRMLFEKVEIIETKPETGEQSVAKEKEIIFKFLRTKSTEESPVTAKQLVDYFVLEDIKKANTNAIISMLKMDGLIEEVPHRDTLVGKWLRVKGMDT